MSDLYDELGDEVRKKSFISRNQIIFVFVMLVFGFYMGNLLYGTNNLIDLLDLKKEVTLLNEEVEHLNHHNAALQKQLIELEVIEGTE